MTGRAYPRTATPFGIMSMRYWPAGAPALADINQAGEAGIPHRVPLRVAHNMPGELLLARIAAVRIEGVGLPRGCAEAAGDRWIAVARVWPTRPAVSARRCRR